MGARGACSTSSRSRAAFSRRYPIEGCFVWSQGLVPLEGFTWHGCPRCLLYIEQVPGGLLTSISHRGWFCLEPRARAARGFYVAWVPAVPALHRAGPGRPSHVDIPSRVVLSGAKGSCRSRVLLAWQGTRSFKCLAVVAAVLQRRRAFLGAAAARVRVVGGVAGGRDGLPRPLRVFAMMMARLQ
jgi:hypothetical protein